ncbi:unnamed protein product, partial [Amoebophrya sp. A25]
QVHRGREPRGPGQDLSSGFSSNFSRDFDYIRDDKGPCLPNSRRWISRETAGRRAAWANRSQAGICFHLFSKKRFETKMDRRTPPEITRKSLEKPVLSMLLLAANVARLVQLAVEGKIQHPNRRNTLNKNDRSGTPSRPYTLVTSSCL